VLLKGGHGGGPESIDLLVTRGHLTELRLPRLPGRAAVHGTGCALSSAIAAGLAQGLALQPAVRRAKAWVHAAIAGAAPAPGGVHLLDFGAELPG
jgi:hydroxymethylpyrimidine/phosphomethylpyrimidine kinase